MCEAGVDVEGEGLSLPLAGIEEDATDGGNAGEYVFIVLTGLLLLLLLL